MKIITKKVALGVLATSTIFSLGLTGVNAMLHGGGSSNQSGHDHNPADMLIGVEKQDLSEAEKDMLYYGYSEELLAHDMYMYFYELYGTQTFKNIGNSELEHITAVKALLDRYELEVPTDYGELTDEFDALKAEGEESLLKALEVGVKIEILDIDDIAETIRTTDNDDFKIMFTNIGGASFNHLRGFLNAINNAGFETEIDYSDYLTEEEVATKGGTLKTKMAEMLEAEGVELPEAASSETIKANCEKMQANSGSGAMKGKGQGGQGNKMGKGQGQAMGKGQAMGQNNDKNQAKKAQYRKLLEKKYMRVFNALDYDKATKIIEKIDFLSEQTRASDNNIENKQNTIALLEALRDIISEKFEK